MHYQAILFDMDGTLLPMDMDEFTNGYFKFLCKTAAPYGYEPKSLIAALWKGTGAMVRNDGSRTNSEAFWDRFARELGEGVREHIPVFDRFYATEFDKAIVFTHPNPLAKEVLRLAREKADHVILATNPLFPRGGQETRLRWMGMSYDDFDLVTDYENTSYAKPNPDYYRWILKQMDLDPARCLMIGNDVQEDMEAAQAAGLQTWLLTDCLINHGPAYTGPQGTYEDLAAMLAAL